MMYLVYVNFYIRSMFMQVNNSCMIVYAWRVFLICAAVMSINSFACHKSS